MKKIYIIGTIILIILVIHTQAKAETTATIKLTSNQQTIENQEEVEITINITEQKTAAYNVTLSFDEAKFDLVSVPNNAKQNGNQVKIVWYDTKGGSGAKQGELQKLKFKAKQEGLANFVIEGEFYGEKGQLINSKFENLQVQIGKEKTNLEKQAIEEQGTDTKGNNANLQALRIDVEGIVPSFETNTTQYDITISNEINNIEVLAIPENPEATTEVTGNSELKEGINTINIKVISQDKTKEKTYTIKVTKSKNIDSANTNLEILAIENVMLNPAFEAHTTTYSAEVSNDTTTLNIFAVPENEKGTVKIVGTDNLKEGNNNITVTVTAPNKISKRDYKINIYKRNAQEEEKYKQKQEENAQKLEEAYKLEKTSANNEENPISQIGSGNIVYIILGIIGAIAVIASIVIAYKKGIFKQR